MKPQTTHSQSLMPFSPRPVKSISRLFPNMKTPMLKKLTTLCLILAAGVMTTRADSLNWDQLGGGTLGGTGTWNLNSTANWWNGGGDVNWADNSAAGTNSAIFAGTAGTVTLNTSLSASNLQFTTTGYTVSGSGTLTLGAGGIDASTLGSGTTTIDNPLSLSGGQQLWQVGSGGTLAINGAVTRSTGAAVDFSASGVTSSTLANDAGGILGGWATVNGISGSGGDWATISGGNIITYSGYTAVSGSTTGAGASAQNWKNAGGSITLTANATINSLNELNDFTINSGVTCTLGSGGLLMAGNTSRWFMGNAGFLTSGAGNGELDVYVPGGTDNNWTLWAIIKDNGATPVTLVKNSAGLLKLGNQNTHTGGTVVNAGTLGYSGTARYGAGSSAYGAVTPFGTGPITMNPGTLLNLGIDIGSGGSTANQNGKTYDIPNAVTVNGATIYESDGFMHLQGALTVGTGGGTLGATWNGGGGDVNKGLFIDGVVSGSGNMKLQQTGFNTGNVWNTSIVFFGNTNTYSGTVTIVPMSGNNGGSYIGINSSLAMENATIDLSGGNNSNQQFGSSPVVFATGIGSATLGALTGGANVVLKGYNETSHAYGSDAIALSIGNNNASTTYSGVMSGPGSLTKIGSGTLTLQGANTYTGNTMVNGGTLALTGSLTSSNITTAVGATFDVSGTSLTLSGSQSLLGSGTVVGSVNTSSGSKIYAGTDGAYGTNHFNNDLTLVSGALAYFDVGTSATGSNDLITVAGTLTLNNNILHVKAPSTSASLQATDYTLITSLNPIAGSFAGISWDVQPLNAGNFSVMTSGNTVKLQYAASTAPKGGGSATPATVVRNENVFISVTATNGTGGSVTSVTVDASPIGGSPTFALVAAGGNIWTNTLTVTPDTLAGGKTLVATLTDTVPLTGLVNIPLTVVVGNDVWNGAGANDLFSTGLNWTNLLAPGYVGDSLEFAGSARLTPDMNHDYTVTAVTFDSGAVSRTISSTTASTLTLSGSGSLVNNSANPQTLNVPLADLGGGLTKTGNGLISLAAANLYGGPTVVNAGTLSVPGSVSGGDVTVAGLAGNAALTVSGSLGGGTNTISVGTVTNAVGALWQTGGTISLGTGTAFLGHMPGTYGYGRIDSGTISMNELQLGSWGASGGNGGNALFEVNGGTVTDTGWLVMARGNAAQTGVLNVFSGSLSFAGGGLICNFGSGQTSVINILGGSVNSSSQGVGLGNGTSILNLNGGLLSVNLVGSWAPWGYQGNNGRVSFNGGTLQASAGSLTFLTVNSANIYSGGATIDNNGNAITIGQALLAPAGNGIHSASVTSGGTGYIAPPIITITNAAGDTTGIGATAIAQINPLTGVVTNVIVTCPGVNYTATPIFVVSGGGATTPAVITGGSLAPNTSGGLVSTGSGTLTLTNANTYTGNTTISNGTLAVATGGSIASTNIIVGLGATFDPSLSTFTLGSGKNLLGDGTVNALVTASSSKIFPGTDGTAGTLFFTGGLTLGSGATVNFDLSTTYNGANDQINGSGTLALNGNALHIKAPSTLVSLDTTADYVLITATGITGNFASTPVWDVQPVNAANFSVVTDPVNNQVRLHYSTFNPPTGSGVAIPSTAIHNQNVLISVTVTNGSGTVDPNTGVVLNASTIGGPSSVALVLASTISSTVHVYTNTITVPGSAAIGSYTLSAVITDSNSQIGTANISLAVTATEVWNGGGSDQKWSTNPNWVVGWAPEMSGDSLIFAGTVGTSPDMDNSYSVTGLTFSNNAASFTIGSTTSSTLTLAGGITNNSANAQILNVPITLSAAQTFNAAAGNLTLGQGVNKGGNLVTVTGTANTMMGGSDSGSGSLFKQGGGSLVISSNSTWDSAQATSGGFSGPLIAQSGTLAFKNGSTNTVAGELVIGGVVANGGAGNNARIVVDNATLNISTWLSVGRGNGVGAVSSDLVLTNGATVTASDCSAGFSGGNSANMPKGSITLSDTSSLIVSNGNFHIGESDGSDMTLNVNGTATVSALTATMNVGINSGKGALNLNGGSVSVGSLRVGSGANASSTAKGTVTVNSGTLNSEGDAMLGFAGSGAGGDIGKMIINGGTVNIATTTKRWFVMNQWDTANSELDVNGGNLKLNANTDIRFARDNNTGTNTINLNSGAITFYSDNATTVGGSGVVDMHLGSGGTVQNTFNLNGGTLTVFGILSANTAGTRTFNFNGGTLKAVDNNASFLALGTGSASANVRGGGAIIDTAGFNVTIAQALVNNGVDPDGGLTKNGAGTLTLSGLNTYTNNTTVNGGTLELAQATLATNSTVIITNAAVLKLDFSTTNQISALVLGGVSQSPGVYNSTTLPAYFSGPGSLEIPSPINPNAPQIQVSVSAGTMTLAWPTNAGWILQEQTNSLSVGLGTNWVDVPGSESITSTNIAVNPASPSVFYRLHHP